MRQQRNGMKKTVLVALIAVALLLVGEGVASAQGPGTAYLACRRDAYSNYYACLDRASGYWGETACYWAGSLDLVACDAAVLTPFA